MTTTTTAAQTLLEAVKINSIEFWLPPYVAISATSSAVLDAPAPHLFIRFQDACVSGLGVAKEKTLTCGDKGAYYKWVPTGAMGDWIDLILVQTNTNVIFQAFGTDAFPLIQLNLSYQFITSRSVSGVAANSITVPVDTTTANALLFLALDNYLDGSTEGAQLMVPVDLATITVNDPSPDPAQWSARRRAIQAATTLITPGPPTLGPVYSSSSLPPRAAPARR